MPASPDPRSPRPLPLHWRLLEAWFRRTYRMEAVSEEADCLLAYNRYVHSGPEVTLQDGTVIRSGDPVLEMHFRREALLPLIADGNPARMALRLLKLGDRDIPRLARTLETDPRLQDVRAIHALTLFHRGIERYGFEVQPVREWWVERWFTWYHRLLMARDHAHGSAHVRENLEKLVTRHVWSSREQFLRRYGSGGSHRRGTSKKPSWP